MEQTGRRIYAKIWGMARDIQKLFGKRLRAVRESKGISQLELAERTGTMNHYLSVLESGQKEVCLKVLDKLARGLGVSLSTLFRGL